jgi:outer membrane protein
MNSPVRILLSLAVVLVLAAASAPAQSKVATISLQKALVDTAEVKAAQADLEGRYKPRGERIAGLQKELAKLNQDAEQNQSKYTEAAMNELLLSIQRKQRDLQRLEQTFNDDLNRERTDLLNKFGQRMLDVVKKLAEEKGFDMVIDVTNLVFAKPATDISADATAAYDKAYPVKK